MPCFSSLEKYTKTSNAKLVYLFGRSSKWETNICFARGISVAQKKKKHLLKGGLETAKYVNVQSFSGCLDH